MSAYVPVNWQDGVSPVNAANLNKMEDRIELLDAVPKVPTPLVEGNWLKVQGGALVWAPAPSGGAGGGLDWEGAYAPATPYVKGDVVTYGGVVYGAVNDSTGQTPPAANQIPQTFTPIPLVTTLPSSPFDGQEVILTDSLTAPTYTWRFRYVAAKASNKWVFVGGAPILSAVDAAETTNSAVYVALTTPGPSITVPVAGDYLVTVASLQDKSGSTANNQGFHSFDIGVTAASDNNAASTKLTNTTGIGVSADLPSRISAPAGALLASKYKATGDTWRFATRRMLVEPIAVGG